MKIVKEDQELMIIKDRNNIAIITGIIFALFGLLTLLNPNFFTNNPPAWSGYTGIVIGVFLILATKSISITIDKTVGKVIFKQKGISRENFKEYKISSIKQLELRQIYTSSKNSKGGYSHKLVFILDTGEEIPLNPYGAPIIRIMGKQINAEKGIGTKISNFLNISFQEKRPPTASETLSVFKSVLQKEIEEQKKNK